MAYFPGVTTPDGVEVVKPYSTGALDWTYAAASGGINNSTSPIVLVAGTTNQKNYLTALLIDKDVTGDVTEFTITDGASTVIFRGRLGTQAMTGVLYELPTPLRSSLGNALNFQLVTSVPGNVYVNAQGYTAS